MSAAVHKKDSTELGVKNREYGLSFIPGKMLLFNDETGALLSLMYGGILTNH